VLRNFDEQATVDWMRSLGVDLKVEPTGKLFPVTDSARTVLSALTDRIAELGIETRFGWRVATLRRLQTDLEPAEDPGKPRAAWQIVGENQALISARRVIVATGGKALPKSGSDGAAYPWLARLGHTIVPPVPALAPLILDHNGLPGSPLSRRFAELSGIAIDCWLMAKPASQRLATQNPWEYGPVLFTHFGLSGPTPMNLSRRIARMKLPVQIWLRFNLNASGKSHRDAHIAAPDADKWLLDNGRASPRLTVENLLGRIMPERVAGIIAGEMARCPLGDLSRTDRLHLASLLDGSPLLVKDDRGFAFAEATAGGVALDEINWRTMESRKAPGLYLCGEVLDVDGRIGGFNFQWAWSSGYAAGRAAAAG